MTEDLNIQSDDMKDLFCHNEGEACISTDRIMVDGKKIGYMYREYPDFDGDSGWRFTAGDEDVEYMENPDNSGLYSLNTVANKDIEIIMFLDFPIGTAFYRDETGNFVKDSFNVLARQEIDAVLYEFNVNNRDDLNSREQSELTAIYEKLKIIKEKFNLSDGDAEDILADIFGECEQ